MQAFDSGPVPDELPGHSDEAARDDAYHGVHTSQMMTVAGSLRGLHTRWAGPMVR